MSRQRGFTCGDVQAVSSPQQLANEAVGNEPVAVRQVVRQQIRRMGDEDDRGMRCRERLASALGCVPSPIIVSGTETE